VSPGVVFAVNHATSQARRKGVWGACGWPVPPGAKKTPKAKIGSNRLQGDLRIGTQFLGNSDQGISADSINARVHGFEAGRLPHIANPLMLRHLLGVIRFGALPRPRLRRI
jgi:hypothetical protein